MTFLRASISLRPVQPEGLRHASSFRRLQRWLLLGAILVAGRASAAGLPASGSPAPAHVEIKLVDPDGKPLRGVHVTRQVFNEEDARPLLFPETTGRDGMAQLEVAQPPESRRDPVWNDWFWVTGAGRWPSNVQLTLAPGASVRKTVSLQPLETTIIHVLDVRSQPAPNAEITLGPHTFAWPVVADDRGVIRYEHPPVNPLVVWVAGVARRYIDRPELDVFLNWDELRQVIGAGPLDGRLLTADGKPAIDWSVAVDPVDLSPEPFVVVAGGSTIATRTERVGRDGRFRLLRTREFLYAISPQGIPVRFPLDIHDWPPGEHHLTFRLPPLLYVHHGVLRKRDGQPAADFPLPVPEFSTPGGGWSFEINPGLNHPPGAGLVRRGAPALSTDRLGRYAIPVYAGDPAAYLTFPDFQNLLSAPEITLRPGIKRPSQPRRILYLHFRDEQGRPLNDREVQDCSCGDQPGSDDCSLVQDENGFIVFVPLSARRLTVAIGPSPEVERKLTADVPPALAPDVAFTVPSSETLPTHSGVEDIAASPDTPTVPDNAGPPSQEILQTLRILRAGEPLSGAVVNVYALKDTEKPQSAPPTSSDRRFQDELHLDVIDVSDDEVLVHFQAAPGSRCIAVARVNGCCVGWQTFTASADTLPSVSLQPARTLMVRLAPQPGIREWNCHITLVGGSLPETESRALVEALGLQETRSGWGRDPVLPGYSASGGEPTGPWFAQDLPCGITCRLDARDVNSPAAAVMDVPISAADPPVCEITVDLFQSQ